jgi:hypothetical protein
VIAKILTHLGYSARAPPRAPTRAFDRFQLAKIPHRSPIPSGSPLSRQTPLASLARDAKTPALRRHSTTRRP